MNSLHGLVAVVASATIAGVLCAETVPGDDLRRLPDAAGQYTLRVHAYSGDELTHTRRLTFQISVRAADGTELESTQALIDSDAYLPAAGTYEVWLGEAGATLQVTGLHEDPRQKQPVEFLDVVLRPTDQGD